MSWPKELLSMTNEGIMLDFGNDLAGSERRLEAQISQADKLVVDVIPGESSTMENLAYTWKATKYEQSTLEI